MAILVTGGAGYIGSHTVVELQNAGYDVVVLDNLSNASEKALDRVSKITGKPVKFYKADILDRDALNDIFDKETIESCIHFAGLKAVGESVVKPWEYYENNIAALYRGYSNQHTFLYLQKFFEYSQLYIEFVPVCSILWEGQIQMTCQVGHPHFFQSSIPHSIIFVSEM